MDPPVYNPAVPYSGIINGGFRPGRMARISGTVPIQAQGFVINLMCGHSSNTSDVGLYLNPRFNENVMILNAKINSAWGIEERQGPLTLGRAQTFEILILCEPHQYKIAVNGKHFAAFNHRVPSDRITSIGLEGEVTVSFFQFEGSAVAGHGHGHAPTVPAYASPLAPQTAVSMTTAPYPVPQYPPVPIVPGTIPGSVYPPAGSVVPMPSQQPLAYPQQQVTGIPGSYPVGMVQQGFPVAGTAGAVYPGAAIGVQPIPGQVGGVYSYEQEKMMKKQMKKASKDKEKQAKDAKKMQKKLHKH